MPCARGLIPRMLVFLCLLAPASGNTFTPKKNIDRWKEYVSALDADGVRKYLLTWEAKNRADFETLVSFLFDAGLHGPELKYLYEKEAATGNLPLFAQIEAGTHPGIDVPAPVVWEFLRLLTNNPEEEGRPSTDSDGKDDGGGQHVDENR